MMRKRLLKAIVRCTKPVWKMLDAQGKAEQILAVTPYNYLDKFAMTDADLQLGNVSLKIELDGEYKQIGFVFKKEDKFFKVEVANGVASFVEFEAPFTPTSVIANGNKLEELEGIQSFAEEGEATLIASCSFMGKAPELFIKTTTEEDVVIEDPNQPVDLNSPDRDLVVSGEANMGIVIKAAKSATLKDVEMGGDSRLNVKTEGAISITNMDVEGTFTKNKGNAQQVLEGASVSINNSTYNATGYNAIEVGMNSKPSNIVIKDVDFSGKSSNNAISIHDTADNAIITVENCKFADVSNVFRFSNKSNVHFTLNVVNCECAKWESDLQYTGMIIFQDFTSATPEEVVANNRFAPEKVTVNITNFKLPDGSILQAPENMSEICGSGTAKQILYVYADKGGLVAYDPARYPTVHID